MANLHLVTGYAGQEHVTAADHGAFNAALIGTGQFVLEKGKVFEAQVISNNQIRVFDGELMMQGRFVRLNPDTYVDLTIENGTQAMLRNDLIVARYTKDTNTGVEAVNLVVIKGKPAESNPSDPEYTEGDVAGGSATMNDFPLWRIPLDGLNVGEPVSLFGEPFIDSMRTLPEIRQSVESMRGTVDGLGVLARLDEGLGSEYVWAKTTVEQQAAGKVENSSGYRIGTGILSNCSYADAFDVADGKFVLSNFSTCQIGNEGSGATNNALLGKYFIPFVADGIGTTMYYLHADESFTFGYVDGAYQLTFSAVDIYTNPHIKDVVTSYGYVNSPDPSAYPIDDGYTYKALGQLGKAFDGVKFASGTYAATGTYGTNNPCSLAFNFAVKILVIAVQYSSNNQSNSQIFVLPKPSGNTENKGGSCSISTWEYTKKVYPYASADGKTVYWYSPDSATHQMNQSGFTYEYFAMGF